MKTFADFIPFNSPAAPQFGCLDVTVIDVETGKRTYTSEHSIGHALWITDSLCTEVIGKNPWDVRGTWIHKGRTIKIIPFDACDEGVCEDQGCR